ncbi:7,8-didemethyl-8-hydroxy-5-deazariboflavin synthase subunit CofG [archaeon SCG-AAA382B04]|nr:7,8-didemethyl-8-hydroxy-5-deazariboflavin synthase subunit CofG [archaeon SCG-AAA382B04]
MIDIDLEKSSKILKNNFEYITYSKNIFIPVTNFCRNNCKYCKFTKGDKFLTPPNKIKSFLENVDSSKHSEILFTFGERPYQRKRFNEKLKKYGYISFAEYIKDLCNYSIDNGFLPHTNPGVVKESFISKIKPYNTSLGLMLETTADLKVHKNSPGKKPQKRLELLELLGKKKIPTTTGILIGIGESKKDRVESLKKIRSLQKRYGHIQEVIIQPCQHKNQNIKKSKLLDTIALARIILKNTNIQSPPNLVKNIPDLIKAGASDLGGISEHTIDYINPNHSWPKISDIREEVRKNTGFELKKRLPIYPRYIKESWMADGVKDLIKDKADNEGFAK